MSIVSPVVIDVDLKVQQYFGGDERVRDGDENNLIIRVSDNGSDCAKGEEDSLVRKGIRASTIVIAASNSSESSKKGSDYTCTGINDEITIQAAVDSLSSTGGKIIILEGDYYKGDATGISLPSNIDIEIIAGAKFKLVNGINADACFFTNNDKVNGNTNINLFGGGGFDCNFRNQTDTTYQYLADFENVSNGRIDVYITNYTMLEAKLKKSNVKLINRKFLQKKVLFAPCNNVNEFTVVSDPLSEVVTNVGNGVVGENSIKITINNQTAILRKVLPQAVADDFEAYEVGLYVKIDNPSAITSFVIGADTGSCADELAINLHIDGAIKTFEPNKWRYLRAPLNRYIIDASPTFALNITSDATATVNIGHVEFLPAPLKPAISWIWDDALDNTLPGIQILSKYGHKGAIGHMGPKFVGNTYMTIADVDKACFEYGWDIGTHHDTHFLSGVTTEQAIFELTENRNFIKEKGWKGSNFLLYAGHNTNAEIMTESKRLFQCIRNPLTGRVISIRGRINLAYQVTDFEITPQIKSAMRRHIWLHPFSHYLGGSQVSAVELEAWSVFWYEWGLLSQIPSDVMNDYKG
ncbi:hypothetical protein PB01_00715 [Psychrobacillus glaciei]|uniref:Uncharacterized protein n=1 Tax=Psychrobacillus glaciei TaxID=2283160 RepID=A0A5J6SI26_9BACI|nr:hypothetical protein [Psychrobacillus glaciei]QFF97451.1 hypothetical protein PB01_00715 [Psychrobacillus glaciei]